MQRGIFYFNFCYVKCIGKVCISTFTPEVPFAEFYTKEQVKELAHAYRFVNPLYSEALKHFPKEEQHEKVQQL